VQPAGQDADFQRLRAAKLSAVGFWAGLQQQILRRFAPQNDGYSGSADRRGCGSRPIVAAIPQGGIATVAG